MKESITNEIGKEIAEKKKLPKEVKEEMNKQVFRNLIFATLIIIYFIFLNLGFLNIDKSIFIQDTAVFAITSLIISIILFERAYRKEKGYLAIHGLEVLAVALLTLFTPYTYFYIEPVVSKIMMVVPIIFAMYYVLKGILICVKTQKNQENKISDIKEIVKKETVNFEETIEMDKDKEAEMVEKTTEKAKKEEKINNEKAKSVRKEKTHKKPRTEKKTTKKVEDKKEEKKTTKKVADKKDEIKPKKTTTRATKKVEDKEKNTIPKKKIETTKKKTTTTKKETTEGTKTRKPREKKEE